MMKRKVLEATEEEPLIVTTITDDGAIQKHSSLDTKSLRSLEVYTETFVEESKIKRNGKWEDVTVKKRIKMVKANFENRATGFAYPMWYLYDAFMELNPHLKDRLK